MHDRIYNIMIQAKSHDSFIHDLRIQLPSLPSKTLECLSVAYCRKTVDRFLQVLTLKEQQKILTDLCYPVKRHHYMWWGFPQETGSWGNVHVSHNTKHYAMTKEEAICYLRCPELLAFYTRTLHYLVQKSRDGMLYSYFGPIDYLKLKSHSALFLDAALSLEKEEVVTALLEIIQRL